MKGTKCLGKHMQHVVEGLTSLVVLLFSLKKCSLLVV